MEPLRVCVLGPIWLRVMRPVKHFVAVVNPSLDDSICTSGEMEFSGQAAGVACIGEKSTDQLLVWRHRLAILATLCGPRISAGQKGSPTWRADWTLCVSLRERNTFADKVVDAGCVYVWITKRSNCVVALLVSTNP